MNTMTRWNPFKEMDDLHRQISSLFALAPRRQGDEKETMTVAEWSPMVDITEDEKEYLIKAELPEVRREDVKVTVENGVLTITGERKFEKEDKGKRYHRIERSYGAFARSFTVPDDADATQVSAEFKDGLLAVRLAKNEKARPRSIEVKVSYALQEQLTAGVSSQNGGHRPLHFAEPQAPNGGTRLRRCALGSLGSLAAIIVGCRVIDAVSLCGSTAIFELDPRILSESRARRVPPHGVPPRSPSVSLLALRQGLGSCAVGGWKSTQGSPHEAAPHHRGYKGRAKRPR